MSGYTAFRSYNGYAPKEGAKVVPIALLFSASVNSISIDLYDEGTNGEMSFAQSVYIDNADNTAPLEIIIPITGQRVTCPASSQGTFPIYTATYFQGVITCVGGNPASIHLCNFAQPLSAWRVM